MTVNRNHRPDAEFRREPKFARFAMLSLVLHLAAALLFSGVLKSRPVLEHRPVYFVDLSKLPVANPRAGRPDGAEKPDGKPAATKPPPAAAPKTAATAPPKSVQPQKPVEPASKPVKPAKEVKSEKAVAATKPKSEKTQANSSKTPKTGKSAPEKPTKQETAASSTKAGGNSKAEVEKNYQETLGAIQAMQAKAEREALKKKLAALASMDTREGAGVSGGGDVPLGMLDGTGDEAGVSQELWLQTFLKQNWSFSKYQASRRDLEATTRIVYDANGKLVSYEFLKKSGDSNFDDSVTKAILKEKQLPFPLKRRINVEVIFNLKDLMD